MKYIIILFLFIVNISYSFSYFWFEKIDKDIVWDVDWNMYETITNLVLYFLTFLSIIWIVFVIKWGFQILTAGWDDEKVKSWRKTIIYALVWIFIVLVAYSIVWIAFDAWNSIEKIN